MRELSIDIEANNLLNDETIDYTSSPYKLKDSFKIWCVVCQDINTLEVFKFVGEEVKTALPNFLKSASKLIHHNGINFDLLALKLYLGLDYTVCPDTFDNRVVEHVDTLVLSKTLNPDRFGGHSLEIWGERLGFPKIDWRQEAIDLKLIERTSNRGAEFSKFHPKMVEYCQRDVEITTKLYFKLQEEIGDWNWNNAIELEKSVAWIVTRQEHRGFNFNKDLAQQNIQILDSLMEERRSKVEPVLPKKPATKGYMNEMTPPARQFLKTGEPSSYIVKFAAKIGGEIICKDSEYFMVFDGKTLPLPLPLEPLIKEQISTIDDTTHIKNWLVGLGWNPSEYKEKDLTIKQGKGKQKRTQDEYEKAVETYVEQTLNCNFCSDRCEFLEVSATNLKTFLLRKDITKSVKVLTNPNFTKGQEKEICPDLERMAEQFPFAKDVVEYLTYKHRRNSILGGGLDWDEDEEEIEKGYLASVRADGRIPTPADTCGAASARFKHRLVANIPRVTSLFGEEMRGMFGVTKDFIQIGYDFDSLEAREESHYCWRYDSNKEYCNSLTMEKPNDVHSVLARKISEIIKKPFNRGPSKSVKYAATYGATEKKIAKTIGESLETGTTIFNAFWEAALPLKQLKEALKRYWETTGGKKFILGIDGRKVPTRSAHAILNSLFQSAGVICAKRAMVIHDNKLREAGLLVDFFKEDWKNKLFCQQLIAYHKQHCGLTT